MSVLKKTKVAAGIAAAVFASGAAQAATITNDSSVTAQTYAKQIVDEAVQTTVDLPNTVIQLDTTESLSVDDSVRFDLVGGATFKAIASADLTDTCVGANCASYSLVAGGPGQTFATFRVNDNPSGANATLTLANTATIDMSSASTARLTATMSGFVGGIATDLFSSPFTSLAVQSVPMMTLSLQTQATGTFDVATGFTSLLGSNLTSNVATANITTSAAATGGATDVTTPVPAGNPTANATLVKLSGPMASVASIDELNLGLLTSSTCAGATTTSTADKFAIDTTNDEACAVMVGGTNLPGATDQISLQITFDGTTTNTATDYTLSVSRLADTAGGYAASNVGSVTPFVFGRNGSAFATNSFGPLNKITVTDRSGSLGGTGSADGQIDLTVYDKTGAIVTCTGLAIDDLTSNATVTIQGADVLGACPGAKRIEGTVNSNSILVTNVKTTADGATATPALSSGGTTAAQ